MAYYVMYVPLDGSAQLWQDGFVLRLGGTGGDDATAVYPTDLSGNSVSGEGIFMSSGGNLVIRSKDIAYQEFTGLTEKVAGDGNSYKTKVKTGNANITLTGDSLWQSQNSLTIKSENAGIEVKVPDGRVSITSNKTRQEAYFNLASMSGKSKSHVKAFSHSHNIGPSISMYLAGTLSYKSFSTSVKLFSISGKILYASGAGFTMSYYGTQGSTMTTNYGTFCLEYTKFRYFQFESGVKHVDTHAFKHQMWPVSATAVLSAPVTSLGSTAFGLRSTVPG